eukprot:c605_g1_i1.p1 GENE.c605_g1_i1~~c605_g1_i1.p1  ORF type:complete len:148 (-),score=1.24 c605_g1_i1:66-509(-)
MGCGSSLSERQLSPRPQTNPAGNLGGKQTSLVLYESSGREDILPCPERTSNSTEAKKNLNAEQTSTRPPAVLWAAMRTHTKHAEPKIVATINQYIDKMLADCDALPEPSKPLLPGALNTCDYVSWSSSSTPSQLPSPSSTTCSESTS